MAEVSFLLSRVERQDETRIYSVHFHYTPTYSLPYSSHYDDCFTTISHSNHQLEQIELSHSFDKIVSDFSGGKEDAVLLVLSTWVAS